MAEGGEENIYTDNNALEPGETENDNNEAEPELGIQQTPFTPQSVDTSYEIIDNAEDFDNRTEMTTNINPVSGALLLRHQRQTEERRRLEPEDVQVEPSASTSSSSEFQSSNLLEQQIDSTPQGNNSTEAAEQSTQSTQYDSDHVDPAEVVLSMTALPISEEPTEPDVGQSEDSATGDVQTPPTLPQPAYEHTAPTTLLEEIPHAPSHFDTVPANEESLPVTTEASDRGSRVTHPGDEGDQEPIQPRSQHAEGVPESEQIKRLTKKLILAFHRKPNLREQLEKMLGDAQFYNRWPADVPDNIDITIPLDYFEDFKLDLVEFAEKHLNSSTQETENTLSTLCANHATLVDGCLSGKLSFSNKSFGYFLANFVSGKLSMDLKRSVFSGKFFRSIKCPPNLKIDGVGEISLEEQRLAERVLKMLIKQHLRVQVSVSYKSISECISKGGLGELPISISTVPIEQPETDKIHLIKKLKTELDVDVKLKGVFSLCYPDPEALDGDFKLVDKSQYTSNAKLIEEFLKCDAGCAELNTRLRLLPCQHKLCGSCLSEMKNKSSEKKCSRCDREYEKEVSKHVVHCPLCKKEHDVKDVFEDCWHSSIIADAVNHPTYSQLKATKPEPQRKKQEIGSSHNQFADNDQNISNVAKEDAFRNAFFELLNASKNMSLDRIFGEDFVEHKDKDFRIGEIEEAGVVANVDDSTDIDERVQVRNEMKNEHEKGTITGLDTKTDSEGIQLSESGEEVLAKYNNVARDRPLQAGDFVRIIGTGQPCIQGSDNATGVIWAKDGECGQVVRMIPTSQGYCDEVEVELFRLPLLVLTFSCKSLIQINRKKAYSQKMKYAKILNELFFLDRPSYADRDSQGCISTVSKYVSEEDQSRV